MPEISGDIARSMKSYVYVYVDPRDDRPFYVGKGRGNRAFQHLKDTTESAKAARIRELLKLGWEPKIDILRYGLTENEALLVEAAAIDLIGKENLTNLQAGHHRSSFPRMASKDLITMLDAKPVTVRHKAVLITINKLYRSDMSDQELYEATRGVWVVGRKRDLAIYAFAVYQGIVREVYRVKPPWLPAGTLKYATRDAKRFQKGRWEFEGGPAEEEIRAEYVGGKVGKGGQNPIRYCNI